MRINASFRPAARVNERSFQAPRLGMASQANSLHDVEESRLVFIDLLRVAAIAFVIIHHSALAYGPTGGFWPVHDRSQSDWFTPFYTSLRIAVIGSA
jgi:hypothetical protein